MIFKRLLLLSLIGCANDNFEHPGAIELKVKLAEGYFKCFNRNVALEDITSRFPESPRCLEENTHASVRDEIDDYNYCVYEVQGFSRDVDKWLLCKQKKIEKFVVYKKFEIQKRYEAVYGEFQTFIKSNNDSSIGFYPSYNPRIKKDVKDNCFNSSYERECDVDLPKFPDCIGSDFPVSDIEYCKSEIDTWLKSLGFWKNKRLSIYTRVVDEKVREAEFNLDVKKRRIESY